MHIIMHSMTNCQMDVHPAWAGLRPQVGMYKHWTQIQKGSLLWLLQFRLWPACICMILVRFQFRHKQKSPGGGGVLCIMSLASFGAYAFVLPDRLSVVVVSWAGAKCIQCNGSVKEVQRKAALTLGESECLDLVSKNGFLYSIICRFVHSEIGGKFCVTFIRAWNKASPWHSLTILCCVVTLGSNEPNWGNNPQYKQQLAPPTGTLEHCIFAHPRTSCQGGKASTRPRVGRVP